MLDSGDMWDGNAKPEEGFQTLAQLRSKGRRTGSRRESDAASGTGVGGGEADQLGLFGGGGEGEAVPARDAAVEKVVEEKAASAARLVAGRVEARVVPAETKRVWGVAELVAQVRWDLERAYAEAWVQGEISNCRPAGSGHLYFTLKDGEAQLSVVIFRRQAMLLRFRPVDGMAVLVRGRVSIYEGRGQLQLIAETVEPQGVGALQAAFEQLKSRLRAEGLFEEERKRALPAFPKCVGIVTSLQGAVLRDMVNVFTRRHARLSLLVYPAVVQGLACGQEVAAGVRWFNAHRERVELIVVARGGGSMEDLAGFNDEGLARAIAESELPVVSAVGHETDFTIADFVADLRAPTPSAAAELITAAQHRIEEQLEGLESRVHRAGRYHLLRARQRYAALAADKVFVRVQDGVERRGQRVDELQARLQRAAERRVVRPAQELRGLVERLRRQDVGERLARARRRLQAAEHCLERVPGGVVGPRRARLEQVVGRLSALSPLAVLGRGYALLYDESGTEAGALVRSVRETAPGRRLRARVSDGYVLADVTEVKEEGQ